MGGHTVAMGCVRIMPTADTMRQGEMGYSSSKCHKRKVVILLVCFWEPHVMVLKLYSGGALVPCIIIGLEACQVFYHNIPHQFCSFKEEDAGVQRGKCPMSQSLGHKAKSCKDIYQYIEKGNYLACKSKDRIFIQLEKEHRAQVKNHKNQEGFFFVQQARL